LAYRSVEDDLNMKILLVFLGLCLIAASAHAYDNTLIKPETKVGGYLCAVTKHAKIQNAYALLVGGKAYLLVDHRWAIGGGGYGVVNDLVPEDLRDSELDRLRMAYGGLAFEYIPWHESVVHLTLGVLVGAGQAKYEGAKRDPVTGEDSDGFFVAEPEVNLEFNVTRFWRMDLGASYLYVNGSDLADLPDEDLSGLAGNLTFKFGTF
jgi:hypothetical protein